jgi:hypothetical protein
MSSVWELLDNEPIIIDDSKMVSNNIADFKMQANMWVNKNNLNCAIHDFVQNSFISRRQCIYCSITGNSMGKNISTVSTSYLIIWFTSLCTGFDRVGVTSNSDNKSMEEKVNFILTESGIREVKFYRSLYYAEVPVKHK